MDKFIKVNYFDPTEAKFREGVIRAGHINFIEDAMSTDEYAIGGRSCIHTTTVSVSEEGMVQGRVMVANTMEDIFSQLKGGFS